MSQPAPAQGGISRRLVVVMAVACGMAVANLYYAQPLLSRLGTEMHVSSGTAGLLVTLTQAGYAAGLMLLVPLGDLVERRRLVTTVLLGTALALAGTALAPNFAVLAAFGVAIGVSSVVAQILVPFAASLAADHERGRVVGMVMSGLLLGILLARTVSGVLGQAAGWRTVYWVAAALMVVLAAVLHHELPSRRERTTLTYAGLLRSTLALLRDEPLLRVRSFYGAIVFAIFSIFWTSVAFLLAGPPYGYGESVIGLFGLAGAAGVVVASVAGRLADRGMHRITTGVSLLILAVSFALIAAGRNHVVPLLAGIVVLDMGVQGVHITNQSLVYDIRPQARSRLNSVYLTLYFVGGALGSAASAAVYAAHGWLGVSLLGVAVTGVGLVAWALEPRLLCGGVRADPGGPASRDSDVSRPEPARNS
ncbi:MAG TPA: MFS transporter [Candidatus Dormibacteraeota bacterium]|jgi:predicted MFS family arabinose efflux permease|nr:MFS transporter [Candidatus Dormibacteraeota bacterium]